MSQSTQIPKPPIVLKVSIREHLALLEVEGFKLPPAERREIPTMAELAAAAGMTTQGLYNISSPSIKKVNIAVLSTVINELRRRGFEVEVGDLLREYPAEIEGGM